MCEMLYEFSKRTWFYSFLNTHNIVVNIGWPHEIIFYILHKAFLVVENELVLLSDLRNY